MFRRNGARSEMVELGGEIMQSGTGGYRAEQSGSDEDESKALEEKRLLGCDDNESGDRVEWWSGIVGRRTGEQRTSLGGSSVA